MGLAVVLAVGGLAQWAGPICCAAALGVAAVAGLLAGLGRRG